MVRTLVLVAFVMVAVVACATDPDAAARDEAEAGAREIAENLELPPGYEVVGIEASRAQTPKENRGGGQSGQFSVSFEPSGRLEPAEVLADFDAWFTSRGMLRAAGYAGTEACAEDVVHMKWADSEKVVILTYRIDGRRYLLVPYSYGGVVTQDLATIETGVPLPDCTAQ
jgi:hypothetical protein